MRVAYPNELYHYGIHGQRWGIRRFQNPDGTLTAAGRKRYGSVQNLMAGRTKKQADKIEREKNAAIASGKTKQVMKYSSEMTKKELDTAIQRIRDEQTLTALKIQETSDARAKLEKIIDTGKTVKNALETTKDLYNLTAQTVNALSGEKKMPVIGEKKMEMKDLALKFKLEQDQKKAAQDAANAERAEKVENDIRSHDYNYFKEHSNDYSTSELKTIQERFEQTNDMFAEPKIETNVRYTGSSDSWNDSFKWGTNLNDIKLSSTSDTSKWLDDFISKNNTSVSDIKKEISND